MKKVLTTKRIAFVSVLSAMAVVLMLFNFPLPIFPSFYQIDLSDIPVLIGGFLMGPWFGVLIQGIKVLLNFIIKGTMTAGVGELANFLIGATWVYVSATLYKKLKNKKSALHGLFIGAISMVIVGCLLNYFVLLPAYSKFMGLELDTIIKMGSAIVPIINNKLSFVLFATLPFNVFKSTIVSLIVIYAYKPISILLNKFRV